MPARSVSQQRLFGMVRAAQKGKLKNPSPQVASIAKSISKKDAKDFAATKHTGLPKKVKKAEFLKDAEALLPAIMADQLRAQQQMAALQQNRQQTAGGNAGAQAQAQINGQHPTGGFGAGGPQGAASAFGPPVMSGKLGNGPGANMHAGGQSGGYKVAEAGCPKPPAKVQVAPKHKSLRDAAAGLFKKQSAESMSLQPAKPATSTMQPMKPPQSQTLGASIKPPAAPAPPTQSIQTPKPNAGSMVQQLPLTGKPNLQLQPQPLLEQPDFQSLLQPLDQPAAPPPADVQPPSLQQLQRQIADSDPSPPPVPMAPYAGLGDQPAAPPPPTEPTPQPTLDAAMDPEMIPPPPDWDPEMVPPPPPEEPTVPEPPQPTFAAPPVGKYQHVINDTQRLIDKNRQLLAAGGLPPARAAAIQRGIQNAEQRILDYQERNNWSPDQLRSHALSNAVGPGAAAGAEQAVDSALAPGGQMDWHQRRSDNLAAGQPEFAGIARQSPQLIEQLAALPQPAPEPGPIEGRSSLLAGPQGGGAEIMPEVRARFDREFPGFRQFDRANPEYAQAFPALAQQNQLDAASRLVSQPPAGLSKESQLRAAARLFKHGR